MQERFWTLMQLGINFSNRSSAHQQTRDDLATKKTSRRVRGVAEGVRIGWEGWERNTMVKERGEE